MISPTFQPLLFINGELTESADKRTFPLYNPTTKEKVADVPEANETDVNAAVAAAKAAFPSWSALSPMQRAPCFKKLATLVREHSAELALLEAISMGRPVARYFDAVAAAGEFDYYSEANLELGTSSLNTPSMVNMTLRQPYGVVAVIIPWNLPLIFLGKKASAALMAGNTVVLKSSEKAPLTCAKIATLINQAGFPPGVFNIISGHGPLSGALLAAHMDIRALTFTGSGPTGRAIQIAAARSNLKHLILELGGKSPAIIFDDADLSKAVAETQHSIKWNSGQVCMANSRIYVQESFAQQFIPEFKKAFASVQAGDPTDTSVDMGPLADEKQYQDVMRHIEQAKLTGTLALGGTGAILDGYFIEPTIFLNIAEDSPIMKTEVFGPVVTINTFRTEEEAIQKANNSEFGLYASVYTQNLNRALRMAKALEAGTVAINCTSPTGTYDMPQGGYKGSGVGRESRLDGMEHFLETKSVLIKVNNL